MRDITLGDTFTFGFTTRAFATGVPGTLAGSPVLSVKEGANDTPITAGVSVDVDTCATPVTGLNEGTIVATSANGYEAGKSYFCYISTGTVGGTSVVGEIVEQFTIQSSAAAVDLANGTDGLGAIKTETAAILLDTGTTLDGRIPAALGADGFMKASVFGMMGTALTETAGQIAAAFKKFFDKATPTGTINSLPDAVAGAASGVAIVGSEMALTSGERTSLAGVIGARQITEGYRANAAAPTNDQAISEILAHLGEAAISGTTKTIKKFDHTTTAETFTLDSATDPSTITRTT